VRARRTLFALALAVHLIALYTPSTGVSSDVLGIDKLVHMLLFGGVLYLGWLAEVPLWPLAAALLVNAAASEIAQYLWLARRSGDVWDAVADAVGVGVAVAAIRRTGTGREALGRVPG
jgi:hypothetical protein